jgi:hypothetical protein
MSTMMSSIYMLLAVRSLSDENFQMRIKNAKCTLFRSCAEQVPLVTYVFEMEPSAAL